MEVITGDMVSGPRTKLAKTVSTLEELIRELHKVFEADEVDTDHVSQLMLSYKSNPAEWRKYAKFDRYRYTRNLVDEGNGKFNLMILCWGETHASAIHDHADAHCFMKILDGELEEIRYAWPTMYDPNLTNYSATKELCCHRNSAQMIDNGNDEVINLISEVRMDGGTTTGGNNNRLDDKMATSEKTTGEFSEINEDEECGKQMMELGRSRLETNGVCYINDSMGLHRVGNPSNVDPAVSLHLYCPPFDACHVFNEQTGRKTKCNVTFWSRFGQKRNREIQDSRAPEDN